MNLGRKVHGNYRKIKRGQSKGNVIYISTLQIFIKIKIFNLKEYMFIFFICR